jgi:uncharacterized repeat protein (TIGR01451 family)
VVKLSEKEQEMKKFVSLILAFALVVSLSLPFGGVLGATGSMTVVSGEDTLILGVYNKAGGSSNFVDLSGSPIYAVKAWEPDPYPTNYPSEPGEATDSTWDNGVNWFENNSSAADWIWETHLANGPADYDPLDPLYDQNAAVNGRVVLFAAPFEIPAFNYPTGATLVIAADNGWEAWVNNGTHYQSGTVHSLGGTNWWDSNLHQGFLNTSGWQSYGAINIPALELVSGTNTLYILAGNEYFAPDDGNTPTPPSQYNPGALIFQLDVNFEPESPSILMEKSGPQYAHEGDLIEYEYQVTNPGEVPLKDISVLDSLGISVLYLGGDDNSDGLLDLEETWTFTSTYLVPPDTQTVTNTAVASGTSPHDFKVTSQDDWALEILHPEIGVEKSVDTSKLYLDGSVTYTVTVTNLGDCTLYNVSVEDDKLGIIATGLTLNPGESQTFYPVTYPVESVTNVVTATGYDLLEEKVSDSNTATVTIEPGYTYTFGYWKTHSNYGPAPLDDTWNLVGEDTAFFLSGKTYYQVLWTSVSRGNAYYQLAHQFIAAKLNVLDGAWMRPDFQTAYSQAEALLGTYTPSQILSFKTGTTAEKAIFSQFQNLAGILDAYNNGLMGTPHAP